MPIFSRSLFSTYFIQRFFLEMSYILFYRKTYRTTQNTHNSTSSSVPEASHLVVMDTNEWPHCPQSFVKSIAPLNVSLTDSMSSFILSIHHSLRLPPCLCFFFLWILHVVHCVYSMEFYQLSFFLHVQTIGVFAGRLCLTELYGYLMLV